jgi:hypothetical protein
MKFATWLGGMGGRSSVHPMLEFDAVNVLQFRQRGWNALKDGLEDPYLLEHILPAEARLFAGKGTYSAVWETGADKVVGVDHVFIRDGKAVWSIHGAARDASWS